MSSCCSSFFAANQRQFSDAVARRDLTRYRGRGPDQTTRLLRDAILGAGHGKTVLDVGAGIGALSFELLAAGVERVTAVEAAPAYVAAARQEAGRRRSEEHTSELQSLPTRRASDLISRATGGEVPIRRRAYLEMRFSGQGMGRRYWMWAPVSVRSASSSWPRVSSG